MTNQDTHTQEQKPTPTFMPTPNLEPNLEIKGKGTDEPKPAMKSRGKSSGKLRGESPVESWDDSPGDSPGESRNGSWSESPEKSPVDAWGESPEKSLEKSHVEAPGASWDESGKKSLGQEAERQITDDHVIWQRISARLKTDLGEAKWKAWIKPLVLRNIEHGMMILCASSSFLRDRILSNYVERIRLLATSEDKHIQHVKIIVPTPQAKATKLTNTAPPTTPNIHPAYPPRLSQQIDANQNAPFQNVQAQNGTSPIEGLDSRFTFENFIVGTPNQLAHATAKRVATSTQAHYNPLFLYGGVGLGKTHLMHAIAWDINARQPLRKVIYLSAEKFMYRFIRALRYKDMMAFKEQFRSVDVLMIDDVQFISGKDSTQEEFFHTFNALVEDGRQVVLSADKSPTDLDGLEERLRSRLGWGMVADIHPADYELRLGILQAKRDKTDVTMPDNVLDFLARKITSNIREVEGAFNRLIAYATLVGKDITIDTSKEVLVDLLRASNRKIGIDDIQKQVAAHFNIRIADMFSARRSRQIARPRQIAMFLAKNLTSLSYPEIGRRFGNRDHTTIMHAVRKIEDLMASDGELADDVSLLKAILSD